MNSKLIITLITVIFATYGFSQSNEIAVYSTSKEMYDSKSTWKNVKSLRPALWSDSLILVSKVKTKSKYASNQIWGYGAKNGSLNGIYKNDLYKVSLADTSAVCIYTKKSGKYTKYYFSKTADSEILPLYKSTLKQAFATNTCFIQKIEKELKLYEDPNQFEKSTGTFKIAQFLKDCYSK